MLMAILIIKVLVMKMAIKLDFLTHIIYVLAYAILCLVFTFYSDERLNQFEDFFAINCPDLKSSKSPILLAMSHVCSRESVVYSPLLWCKDKLKPELGLRV